MTHLEIEITDPASELAELFIEFAEIDPTVDSTQNVLSGHFDLDPSSPEWFEIIGAIAQRVRFLSQFISTVDDSLVKDRMRGQTLNALKAMGQVMDPSRMNDRWDQTRNQLFSDNNIGPLESFANTARKYHPLRLLSDDERTRAIDALNSIIEEYDVDGAVPDWSLNPIYEGARRLKRLIQNLRFFGHEVAIDALINLNAKIDGLLHEDLPKETRDGIITKLRNAAGAVALIGTLFILPDAALSSFNTYKDAALKMIVNNNEQQIKLMDDLTGQKAIPAPVNTEDVAP